VRWRGEAPHTTATCPTCGWTTTADEYHRSWEHRDLNGHCDEFQYYLEHFPPARSSPQRMLLIDRLVHALHVAALEWSTANFAAHNFLEANRPTIVALLERATRHDGSRQLGPDDLHPPVVPPSCRLRPVARPSWPGLAAGQHVGLCEWAFSSPL